MLTTKNWMFHSISGNRYLFLINLKDNFHFPIKR